MPSIRFRTMYRDLGLTRTSVAQLLRVSERTIHNWETGHHQVPYSAYKLVRLMRHQEFPNSSWAGWHMTAGVLYTPEGHGFKPQDSSWWSLLCRKAAMFDILYARLHGTSCKADDAAERERFSAGLAAAPVQKESEMLVTLHNMLDFEQKQQNIKGLPCPAKVRYSFPKTLISSIQKGG